MISVLYIDDSPGLLREMKQFLERSGFFSVDGAGSGTDALAHYPFSGYDVIISSDDLTGMKGTDILQKVREYDPIIPFILIANTPNVYLTDNLVVLGADYTIQRQGPIFQFYEELSLKIIRSVKRRQRERKIRDRNRKADSLMNPFLEGNFVITREGKILHGGSDIASALSISIDILSTNGLFSFMEKEERCQLLSMFDKLKETPEKNFEFGLIGIDHIPRYLLAEELRVYQNDEGEELFIFQGLSDVSKMKKADLIFRKIDQICNLLLNTIDGVLWTINTVSMAYAFVSSSCRRVFGYPAEDLIGGEISRGDIIVTSRPVSEKIWERAVCYLSSDNPPGFYSDRFTLCHKNGSAFNTEVISEFFLNEERDILMVRGYSIEIPDIPFSDSCNNLSDTQLMVQEKIRVFLDALPEMILALESVSGNRDFFQLKEKADLLRFASHHQCVWECDNRETLDHELSDLQSLYDQF